MKIRQSEITAFRTCPREWWLKYVRELVRKPQETDVPSTADVGTLYHTYIEDHYRNGVVEWDEPPKALTDQYLAWRMATGYVEWLAETGSDAGWQIEAIERQIEVPFGTFDGEEVILTGKLDLEILDPWGLPKIVDNKSVQNLDQANMLYLNQQGRTYSLFRRLEGKPVQGFIHNQGRRVLRTGTAKPPFYDRVEVRYNDTLLDNHHRQLIGTVTRMVEIAQKMNVGAKHHDLVPPQPSRDCSWRCDFLGACGMMDDGSDAEGYLEEFFAKAGTIVTLQKEGDANS